MIEVQNVHSKVNTGLAWGKGMGFWFLAALGWRSGMYEQTRDLHFGGWDFAPVCLRTRTA